MNHYSKWSITYLWICFIALQINPITLWSQVVPDYKVADCDGSNLDIKQELDAGKVIVLGWAMPCATCVSPLLSVHNAVLNFAISHPGKVSLWIIDDYANTPCATLKSWCQNNGISVAKYIVSKDIKMLDFGSNGMPKVVVLGCNSGKVYYNVNNSPDGTGVTLAIQNALKEIADGCVAGSENINHTRFQFFPNPVTQNAFIKWNNEYRIDENIKIAIYNSLGQEMNCVPFSKANDQLNMDLNHLPNGLYHVQINTGHGSYVKSLLKYTP